MARPLVANPLSLLLAVLVWLAHPWAGLAASDGEALGSALVAPPPQLSLPLAEQLADDAVRLCQRSGSFVSATVVTATGAPQVMLSGDGAVPHSRGLSQQKAYTAVSMAALQGLHTTSELQDALAHPRFSIGNLGMPSDPVAQITPVPGGVVIRWQGAVLAGLGVSGARQGSIDERCALDAEERLLQVLNQPTTPPV